MMTRTLPTASPTRSRDVHDPAYQAFTLLRTAFTVAPIVFGVDKFFDLLTNWQRYLSPTVDHLVPGTGHQLMLVVGVVEILAGVLVAVRPHIGGYLVVGWLAGIIGNLLLIPGFYDVALRDFGLLLAALALARMASVFRPATATAIAGADVDGEGSAS